MEQKKYYDLSEELQKRILEDRKNGVQNPYKTKDEDAIRRRQNWDRNKLLRPAYVRDCEKIMHTPFYNRYADKTQVFSFYKNDDITRRALHVQLVSRISRNIGNLLGLNVDLIEAIALGHDIGHTPFGHAGERYLSECLQEHTGRYFNHNVHSVHVLDGILKRNISLQTLDGILCHNGEFAMQEYRPVPIQGFSEFDKKYEQCYVDEDNVGTLVPYTLEACVVRICDMIAYLGKDRQDAQKAKLIQDDSIFSEQAFGKSNPEIINNLIVNIVENSYGKDCIEMDPVYFQAIKETKKENYKKIYFNEALEENYNSQIQPMIHLIYEKMLKDLREENTSSVIYTHHINYIAENAKAYGENDYLEKTEKNQIVVDYIASMTDDYFVDLFAYLFPDSKYHVEYIPYFDE
ncbi:MAG: HD domain-containing protein [Lachnospiraceae bacterium]|nr:HD domain-containing protein [Lachnospiraceae bacterium]